MTTGERLALIGLIKGGLHVQIVPSTQMVDISYRSNDPKLATDVVNKLVDTYIDEDLRSKFDRTMHVSIWLQKQLEGLRQAAGTRNASSPTIKSSTILWVQTRPQI